MRIMVMSLPGGDADTPARALAERYGIPLFRLEDICKTRDGSAQRRGAAEEVLASILKNPDWVLVGSYPALLLEKRIKAADMVILYSPKGLRKKLGILPWLRQRKARGRMVRLFRALEARQNPKIHCITDLDELSRITEKEF